MDKNSFRTLSELRSRQRFFAVVPRSPLAKVVASLLTLTFAVLALLLFGVILAGAVALAALAALVMFLKPGRPVHQPRGGRIIEGESRVEKVETPARVDRTRGP